MRYFVVLFLLSLTTTVSAQDWPQFRGPNRDGVSLDSNLLGKWPEAGPKLLWTATGAGRGYSSFSITDGKLFTVGDGPSTADDKDEYLLCFDLSNGKQLWKKHIGPAWKKEGPDNWQSSRSTPTLDGGNAYVLTAHGELFCCKTSDGEVVWQKSLQDDFEGKKGDGWGFGESVLIDGEHLVCTPGNEENTMLCLNKATGEKVWGCSRSGDRGAGHASIQISEIGGEKIYVNTTASGAMGVRASDGELMWTYDIDETTAVIPNPIVKDDLVFFTAGYGRGGALLRQVAKGDGVEVEEVYGLNNKLQNKHGGVVMVDGHLYGDSGDKGMPFCADMMTGEVLWKERGSGKGSAAVTAADGHLYFVYQNSTVELLKANPKGYERVGSFKLEGHDADDVRPTWAHPVIVNGRLYVRQDDKIFCFDVRA